MKKRAVGPSKADLLLLPRVRNELKEFRDSPEVGGLRGQR